jgi:hypothetical protein
VATLEREQLGRPDTVAGVSAGEPPSKGVMGRKEILWLALLIALYSLPLAFTLRPSIDLDIWWHIRAGEWIVQNQTIPQTDPFSSHGQDKTWVAYSWLFEVLVYGLYAHLGLSGILLFRASVCLAIALAIQLLVRRSRPQFILEGGLALAAVVLCAPLMWERPWLFTILFYILTLQAVSDFRRGKATRLFFLLPLVYILWANLHIQFVQGLFLLGLACAAPVIDRILGIVSDVGDTCRPGSRRWQLLVLMTAFCTLATLATPYHVHLWHALQECAAIATDNAFDLIHELRPIGFRSPLDWGILGLTIAAFLVLGRSKRISSFDVLLLLSATYFSFRSRREIWLVAVVGVYILASAWPRSSPTEESFRFSPGRCGLLLAGLLIALWAIVGFRGLSENRLQEEIRRTYPADAVAFVKRQGYPGPLYNDYNWGGYLMWEAREWPVAIDGRANLHGGKRLLESLRTWLGAPGWRDAPDLARARLVIAPVQAPLVCLLRLDPSFEAVYEDSIAVVFVSKIRTDDPQQGQGAR